MPFWDVPAATKPDNPNVKIWRYMTFAKFVSFLEKQALYFTRIDRLQDAFEGTYPLPDIAKLRQPIESGRGVPSRVELQNRDGSKKRVAKLAERQLLATRVGLAQAQRTWVYVNCWHMNDYESAAMWDVYSRSGEGVAIQSTYQKLGESLSADTSQDVLISTIKYIDYDTDSILADGTVGGFSQMLCKRKSYEHERELRAFFWHPVRQERNTGEYIRCEASILVEKLYIAPTSPRWFFEAVKASMTAFGLQIDPTQSRLRDSPLW